MMEEELVCCLMGHKMRSTLPQDGTKCAACARSSSESGEASYYTCSECKIVIHRECAQLPKQIDHPMHPEHPLLLLAKPPYQRKTRFPYVTCRCQVCKKDWKNFVYHCPSCDFDVDVLCAFLENDVNNAITIPTHHHPVRLIRRPAKFRCNACNVKSMRVKESFMCTKPSCGFWIHKKCGSLPELFKHPDHHHTLQVAITMPDRYRKYNLTCEICRRKFGSSSWIYYCQQCKYFIHIRCRKDRFPVEMDYYHGRDDNYPLRLVMISEMKTVTKHIIPEPDNIHHQREVAHHEYLRQLEDRRLAVVKVDSHAHPLVLFSDMSSQEDETRLICDGCIELIDRSSYPYYKCGQKCNFSLHTTCANLPKYREVSDWHHEDRSCPRLELCFPEKPSEVVKCKACQSLCNGYGYKCTREDCNYYLDIKCSYFTIGRIKHMGHNHHLYSQSLISDSCSSCGLYTYKTLHFCCFLCGSIRIGYECATLPSTAAHRWDKHPLILTFPPFFRDSPDADEEFFCEVCEDEIHPKHWIYRCAECDQSFHPRCIPTLGECRNIKFGKVFRIQSHPHPLTLVPQAKLTSKCYYCRKFLNWSRAYECAPCGFYLCPDCIPKEELVEELFSLCTFN